MSLPLNIEYCTSSILDFICFISFSTLKFLLSIVFIVSLLKGDLENNLNLVSGGSILAVKF
jgi:hypothetical protein